MQYFIIKSRGFTHGFLLFQGILLSSDLISLAASESLLEASETPSSSIFVVSVAFYYKKPWGVPRLFAFSGHFVKL